MIIRLIRGNAIKINNDGNTIHFCRLFIPMFAEKFESKTTPNKKNIKP